MLERGLHNFRRLANREYRWNGENALESMRFSASRSSALEEGVHESQPRPGTFDSELHQMCRHITATSRTKVAGEEGCSRGEDVHPGGV